MAHIFHYLIFVLFVVISPIAAQLDCTFNGVSNLVLSQDSVLSWEPAPWGTCTIDHYLIFITSEYEDEKVYMTVEPKLDVSFLPICKTTKFVIIPVSPAGIQGGSFSLNENMPVPPHVNLTIADIYVGEAFGGILVGWWVEEKYSNCAKNFRVLIFEEDSDTPIDEYVTFNFEYIVDYDLIPCSSYRFGVRALYNLENEGPLSPLIRYTAHRRLVPTPTLKSLRTTATTVDLVWQMQSFLENKCPVSSVTVDASPYFKIAYPVTDQNSRPSFPTTLTGLQPDTMYMLRVTANTDFGTTMPFFVGVQTIPSS